MLPAAAFRLAIPSLVVFLVSPAWSDEIVTLRSGQASLGSLDPLVTMLEGPANTFFPAAFTADSFASAASGPHAKVTTLNSLWTPQLPSDPVAKWINNTGTHSTGGTVLFAVPFHLSQAFVEGTLDLHYAVDNRLGEGTIAPCPSPHPRAGVYINGTPLPGTDGIGNFDQEYVLHMAIGSLLTVGDNVLYLYEYDCGSSAGIVFTATITTTPITPTVPVTWGTVKARYR